MFSPNQEIFSRHTDSVLCCAIDDRPRLAVSGGIDDTAFVWDLDTNHVIFECGGHKESVTAAGFNLNSAYVATGDLNGYIQVRNTTTGIRLFESEIDEINWILWHNKSEFVLLAGTSKGDFWMWNVNDPAAVKIFNSYGCSTTIARLLDDGVNIVVGYHDGAIRTFDLKSSKMIDKVTDPGAAEIISMDVSAKGSLLVVGSIDSTIRIFTLNSLRPIGTLYCKSPKDSRNRKPESSRDEVDESMDTAGGSREEVEVIDEYSNQDFKLEEEIIQGDNDEEQEDEEEDEDEDVVDEEDIDDDEAAFADEDSVESVVFSPCGNYVAAANNSGSIMIWDVSSKAKRCEKHTGIGVTRCIWTNDMRFVTACLDGNVRVYDLNLNEVKLIEAHTDQILDMAYREGRLLTASEDKTCRVSRL